MSIISSICAEADLKVVKKAVARAKKQAIDVMTTAEDYNRLTTILDDLQVYCEERISE
jgi:hypothetical protein